LLLAAQEAPNRRVIDSKPALRKLFGQTAQGHMGIIRDTLKNPALVLSRQKIRPVAAHFARCGAPRAPLALRPFDDARHAHLKRRRHRPGAFTRRHTRHRPLA
jgi:hypothetical protein